MKFGSTSMGKKKKELRNFKPDEVSLVTSGANMKTAFIIKNNIGEKDMSEKDLIAKLEDFKFANEDKTMASVEEVCKSQGLDDTQKAALKTALAIMESTGMDASSYSFSVGEEYASVAVYKQEAVEEVTEEVSEAEEEVEADAETTEEVETVVDEKDEIIAKLSDLIEDKEAVAKIVKSERESELIIPESIRKQLEVQADFIAKVQKEKEEAEQKLAKAESEKIEKEFKDKAALELGFVAEPSVLGNILFKCKTAVDADTYECLEKVLKDSNAKIEQSNLFKEVGETVTVQDEMNSEDLVEKKAQEIMKSDERLSKHKARVLAREQIAKEAKNKQ